MRNCLRICRRSELRACECGREGKAGRGSDSGRWGRGGAKEAASDFILSIASALSLLSVAALSLTTVLSFFFACLRTGRMAGALLSARLGTPRASRAAPRQMHLPCAAHQPAPQAGTRSLALCRTAAHLP